ncbi:hypothetical protein D0962_36825 [Leptolyngbyaceae cyanobacterium CCMR0082]|uniref:Uncharacterized protein n=2 Tax=Adonisia TaxID=2950183 RepID=A0A6M0SLS8_9CYAN|nr:hypothetical protein [Adonisia turfae CCMR0082]
MCSIMRTIRVPIIQAQEAYSFYRAFILEYSRNKAEIYERYGFSLQGSVGSKDWEVFAAILLNDRARRGDGADLENYEVKSATTGSSFEYQYHRNHGLDKLTDDKNVDHIFVSRSKDYMDVEVWVVERTDMTSTFDKWLPELLQNYETAGRQRFRRSVTYGFVRSQGNLLLEIRTGELTYSLETT